MNLSASTAKSLDSTTDLTLSEIVELGAVDAGFYARVWFPKTVRQQSPAFHAEMDKVLDSPDHRFVGFKIFRDGAKTTKVRLYLSRRIAYAISRTILVVGKSQGHAAYTLSWIKNQVMYNKEWASAFGLSKGDKWAENHIEIRSAIENCTITVLAVGITGSVRGININDYRPDLIVADDPDDEESTGTPEQREKASDLFFGALANSLAPRSESPHAKMVLLETPLNDADLINVCEKDPTWYVLSYGCFDDSGESRWAERWPTNELLAKKAAYIARNQLSLWMREMECKIVSRETSAFLPEWLQFYDLVEKGGSIYISVDPTPPPRIDAAKNKDRSRNDDAVVMAWQRLNNQIRILEIYYKKSPDDNELLEKIFEYYFKYKHLGYFQWCGVETILFARTISRALQAKMQEKRVFFPIREIEDKRNKETRIRQEISGRAQIGNILIRQDMTRFQEHFLAYPNVNHDDDLDALATGLTELTLGAERDLYGDYDEDIGDQYYKDAETSEWRGCP